MTQGAFAQRYDNLRRMVDRSLAGAVTQNRPKDVTAACRFALAEGGKRLRAIIVLLACQAVGGRARAALNAGCAVEIMHNFTLVHDDIMDHATVRRNLPTVHSKWNLNQAVLSGDVMAFIANECFLQTPQRHLLKVFKVFNKAAIEVCVGQQLDIDFEKAAIVTHEEYLRMIDLKTAALMAASAKIGAIIGGADEKDSEILFEFGRNLGLAFQIQDDLLDIYGDAKVFGKIMGGDIISNKKTFLHVKALEIASVEQSKLLNEQFGLKEFDPETKVKKVTEIYDQLNIKNISERLANEYISTAFNLLGKVSIANERKTELVNIANSLIGRNN